MRVISMSAVALGPEMQVASAGGCGQRSKYSGKRFHNLAGVQNAEVPVGQQGEHAAAFGGGVVQHDGSRVGDAAKGRGDHAFGTARSSVPWRGPWSIFHSNP